MGKNNGLKLPGRPLRDATRTGNIQKRYMKELYGLYLGFQYNLQPSLNRLLARSNETGFAREFQTKLDEYSAINIYAGAPKIIERNTVASYSRGKQDAVNNPRIKIASIRIPSELSILDNRMIDDLRGRGFSLVTKLTEDMNAELMRVMTEDIRMGKGIPEMTRDIMGRIPEFTRSRAETIARTETSYSYTTARAETYKSAGLKEWQWLATLGSHCCDECVDNHGEVFTWDDPMPPLHPNCLCTILPVVPGEE